jgi:putative tricarboxylic transport membrane protein
VLALALLAYPISAFALSFGPREYLALGFFALSAVASLSSGSPMGGVLSALLGMFLATVGIDELRGTSRFHFGELWLMGGVPFIPVIIGLFAIPETLVAIEGISVVRRTRLQITRILPDAPDATGADPAPNIPPA